MNKELNILIFFAGAGTLNYGHNNEHISKALIEFARRWDSSWT